MKMYGYLKSVRQQGRRAFNIQEVMEELGISYNYAKVCLHRLLKENDVISPAKGFYVIIPPEYQPYGCIPAEELVPLLMDYLKADYYIGLLSGAAFYGATHQKAARFQIISNKRITHALNFGKVSFELIYKKSLENLPTRNFSVSTGYLKVGTPELIALDLFKYPTQSGGLNHIATVLSELIESIDEKQLIDIANKTKGTYHMQRFGYILEKIEPMDEHKKLSILSAIKEFINTHKPSYIPLAPEISSVGCPYIKKWHIIENTDIESDL